MTTFVDASALVAIIAPEEEAAALAHQMDRDTDLLWSPIVLWETVAALCRSYDYPIEAAERVATDFAHRKSFRLVSIGEKEAGLAVKAYAQYGKGRHRAGLNMGDCFAYACAKANGAALLYKGEDFARTDLA